MKISIEDAKNRFANLSVQKGADDSSIVLLNDDDYYSTKYDDDSHARLNSLEILIKQAISYLDQRVVSFEAIKSLLSSAYRYADITIKADVSSYRQLVTRAISLQVKKVKKQEKLKAKGISGKDLTKALREFSTSDIESELREGLESVLLFIESSKKILDGRGYDEPDTVIDLSEFDAVLEGITYTRSDIVVSCGMIDVAEAKRKCPKIEIEHRSGPIYTIKKALIVGFRPGSLPSKINVDSLSTAIRLALNIHLMPLDKMIKHKTSSRLWFYIPEYSLPTPKTVLFADKFVNDSMSAFKNLSNDPSEEDVAAIFYSMTTLEELSKILETWKSIASRRSRMTFLYNEYKALELRHKTRKLRMEREKFLESNRDITQKIKLAEDDIEAIKEDREYLKKDFATRASHTGNSDHGLPISKYNRIDDAFHMIESVAVRNISNSEQRRAIRKGIRKDRFACRSIYFESLDLKRQASIARNVISTETERLKKMKELAFLRGTGRLEHEPLELDL